MSVDMQLFLDAGFKEIENPGTWPEYMDAGFVLVKMISEAAFNKTKYNIYVFWFNDMQGYEARACFTSILNRQLFYVSVGDQPRNLNPDELERFFRRIYEAVSCIPVSESVNHWK